MPRLNDTRMNFRTGTEISVPSDPMQRPGSTLTGPVKTGTKITF